LILTAALGVIWIAVMFALDTLYTRRLKTPTSVS
jgi:hypothetical protein